MNRNNILLLGGDGFIGSALARQLSEGGYQVHVVSRHLQESTDYKNCSRYKGNLADTGLITELLPTCETIVRLASRTSPGVSARRPSLEAELNIRPTLQFLQLLSNYDNKHLIFISSGGTLYGNPKKIPASEDMALQPLSYHGAGKLAIETFLGTFAHLSGHRVTIVRPSNVYGPGQHFQSGFGVIRTILEHLRNDSEMEIWGDGTIIRDFLYIDDIARALETLIRAEHPRRIYNVGTGRGYSLMDVIGIIEAVSGRKLKTRHVSNRLVDVQAIVLDASCLKQDTGWTPTVSLEEGIQITWNWLNS